MTVTTTIDRVTEWVKENICDPVKLKEPPDNDAANDENYEYRRITPACYSLFLPGEEKTAPPFTPQTPSVCVKVLSGKTDLTKNEMTVDFELSFCGWDPGVYGKDVILADKNEPMIFREWKGEEADNYFKIDGQGWRDLWNWIDTGLHALYNTTELNGITVDRSAPITFGPYADEESIIDIYPYWIGWIGFKTKMPIAKNIRKIEELL